MKPKSNKSGLLLCSIITTSAVGVSQVSTSTSSALFANLGQKIKEGAEAAVDKTWGGIKAGANYLWKNEKAAIFCSLFVGSASLFPKVTGAVLTGIGKAMKGTAMSIWNLPPGTREIAAVTIFTVGWRAYKAWDDWRIDKRAEEKIKKMQESLDEARKKDLEQSSYLKNLVLNDKKDK